jgi:hypothetical protein
VQPLGRRRAGIYVQQHGASRRVLQRGSYGFVLLLYGRLN